MVHLRIWEKVSQRWKLRTSLMKGSARHAKWTLKIVLVSQLCLTSYPIIQSNSLPDGDRWTTQLPSSAVRPGGSARDLSIGAGNVALLFTGVNSNTWKLRWGALSQPTPACCC